MSKAQEIAAERFAKGEIDEAEFLSIVEKLNATQAGTASYQSEAPPPAIDSQPQVAAHSPPSPQPTVQAFTGAAPAAANPAQQEVTVAPNMITHYQNAQLFSDLKLPAGTIAILSKGVIFLYIAQLFALFRTRDKPASFNMWVGIGSGSSTDPGVLTLSLLVMLPEIILMIAGCVWIYRATKNLFYSRIQQLKYSPGWSVGWFFIPVAFFFMPVLVMHQIVAGSKTGNNWAAQSISPAIVFWWILFWVVAFAQFFFPTSVTNPADINAIFLLFAISHIGSAISLYLFSEVVAESTREQQKLQQSSPVV